MDLKPVYKHVEAELELLNSKLLAQGTGNYKLVRDIVSHVIAKGKRVRPILLFLLAKAFGIKNLTGVVNSAFAIELIHTASLLHDDVVDETKKRRGKKTANTLWGNKETILVGDYLFTQSFLAVTALHNFDATQIITSASSKLTIGEITQLENEQNTKLTMSSYMDIIYHKTASLFEAAGQLGALFSENGNHALCGEFAKNLGFAFQMIDDILDYTGTGMLVGKDIGTDFKERKVTLPVLILLENADKDELRRVNGYFSGKDSLAFLEIDTMLKKHDVVTKCYTIVDAMVQKAEEFVQNEVKDKNTQDIIKNLLVFMTERQL